MAAGGDITADICIIGAGSAGLSVAAGATRLGARTVLIEASKMGGECLNTGCVPSKALLAAAKAMQAMRRAHGFGVEEVEPRVDYAKVRAYVHEVIATVAPHDSAERFTKLGCRVIKGHARFLDRTTVEADDKKIRARRFVIATGSRPSAPPILGLAEAPFFTNETIFENSILPEHLVVIGAGPIGCEMAQAHRRLGAKVTMLDIGQMMPKDHRGAVEVVRRCLQTEGVEVAERVKVLRVEKFNGGIKVAIEQEGRERVIEGSHLLVATGRRPNIENLGLDAAGVCYSPNGVEVDARLRTTNKRIFAAGDVAGGYQFTHVASYHAGIVLKNSLFRLPVKNTSKAIPWVTYTDPELAQVGLLEHEARRQHGDDVRVLRAEFSKNDRAQTEGETEGFVEAVVIKRGHVLGTTIVGAHAGELILPWALAISERLKIGALANLIIPYPTMSESVKGAAGAYYAPMLFSPLTRKLVHFLGLFG